MYSKIVLLLLIFTTGVLTQINIKCSRRTIANGSVKLKKKGTFAHHFCKKGFELVGQRYINCVRGRWEAEAPFCVKPGCPPVNTSNFNGTAIGTYNDAVVYFSCLPGFDIFGKNLIYCDGNKWSSDLPTCVGTGKNPETGCDFETDLCGWTHSLNHDFDWKRQNFKTLSGHLQTGPSYDHTKGLGKDGYYMYIESVSQEPGDYAMLISPMYDKMIDGFCFRFYYYMYGTGIGYLRVYIRKENDSPTLLKLQPVFSKFGNQGDRWIEEIVTVDKMDKPFQVIIEGVRGESIVSDIAIDDVELFDKDKCPQSENPESSESFDNSTTDAMEYGSCLFRCYVKSDNQSCDCYDGCEENNSCCPDYKPLCLFNQTDFTDTYSTETDLTGSTMKGNVSSSMDGLYSSTVSNVSEKPVVVTTRIPMFTTPATTRKTLPVVTEKPTPVVPRKPLPVVTQKPTPVVPRKPLPVVTQKPTPFVPRKPLPVVTQKPLVIVTNSTPVVPRKTLPVVPQKTIPVIPPKTRKPPPVTQKSIPVVTRKTLPVVPTRKSVPVVTRKETTYIELTTEDVRPTMFVETDFIETESFPLNEKRVSVTIEKEESYTTDIITIVTSSAVLIVVIAILITAVYKRHRIRFNYGTTRSDSLSDVRFLTSDEILDFTLQRSEQ